MEDLEISPEAPAAPEETSASETPEAVPQAAGDAQAEAQPSAEEPASEPPAEEAALPFPVSLSDDELGAILEAVVYVADEPLTLAQIATGVNQSLERVETLLRRLMAGYENPAHGIAIREVAGGFKMATKPEHHEAVRGFVKSLKPPLKLSLPALETLAVIAYKQPVTAPEIMEIRGVQGAGVLKTLLDRKLIAGAGRKNVIGKPMLYKTTKEFLIQFGLKDIAELPTLKEFEEIRRMAFGDNDAPAAAPETATAQPEEASPAPSGPAEQSAPATAEEQQPAATPES
jgi:segregation and condensation protein B